MLMNTGVITDYGLILLIISGGLQWIREWKKGGAEKKNGNALKNINENISNLQNTVGKTNIKMAQIKTAVNAQKTQCEQTVGRFDKTIREQNQEIIKLAGRRR